MSKDLFATLTLTSPGSKSQSSKSQAVNSLPQVTHLIPGIALHFPFNFLIVCNWFTFYYYKFVRKSRKTHHHSWSLFKAFLIQLAKYRSINWRYTSLINEFYLVPMNFWFDFSQTKNTNEFRSFGFEEPSLLSQASKPISNLRLLIQMFLWYDT